MNKEILVLVIFTMLYFGRSFYLPDDMHSDVKHSKTVVQTGISN